MGQPGPSGQAARLIDLILPEWVVGMTSAMICEETHSDEAGLMEQACRNEENLGMAMVRRLRVFVFR